MTTPFSLKKTAETFYPHAVTLTADQGQTTYVFVGNVFPLTAKRKRAIATALCDARNIPMPADPVQAFDRTAFGRDTNYALTRETVTDNATGETRETFSYSHTMGLGGGMPASGLHVITIN